MHFMINNPKLTVNHYIVNRFSLLYNVSSARQVLVYYECLGYTNVWCQWWFKSIHKRLILRYAFFVCLFLLKFIWGLPLARKQFLFLHRSSQLRITSTIPNKFYINWGAGNGRRALPFCCQPQQLLVWQDYSSLCWQTRKITTQEEVVELCREGPVGKSVLEERLEKDPPK